MTSAGVRGRGSDRLVTRGERLIASGDVSSIDWSVYKPPEDVTKNMQR